MSPEVTAAIIAGSISVFTLIVTLVAQYFSRRVTSRDTKDAFNQQLTEQRKQLDRSFEEQRNQLDKTLDAQSDQLDKTLAEQRTRTLNERFATAADQLGSDKPAVRLAGVYAMAGLADDWEKNRQTCVDVLCAYLRMPYEPDPGQDASRPQRLAFQAIREVRHTVIRVITAHLKDDASEPWQDLDFDFTGVAFDGGDFVGAHFRAGTVLFSEARFSGEVGFGHTLFSGGGVSFHGAEFSGGRVSFTGAQFSGGTVDFGGAQFSGGTILFSGEFSGSTVHFGGAKFSGSTVRFGGRFRSAQFSGGRVSFTGAQFSGGTVDFAGAEFSGSPVSFNQARFSGGRVGFDDAEFSGGVSFNGAEFAGGEVDFYAAKFSGGEVDFYGAGFSRGKVDFEEAQFYGGTVRFDYALFTGGLVDFSKVRDWSYPPKFPWTGTPPPGVKLPSKEDPSQP
jgi:uncharacterized protein YjbI with pentapeptide repeats